MAYLIGSWKKCCFKNMILFTDWIDRVCMCCRLSRIILCMGLANERWRYNVTASLVDPIHRMIPDCYYYMYLNDLLCSPFLHKIVCTAKFRRHSIKFGIISCIKHHSFYLTIIQTWVFLHLYLFHYSHYHIPAQCRLWETCAPAPVELFLCVLL